MHLQPMETLARRKAICRVVLQKSLTPNRPSFDHHHPGQRRISHCLYPLACCEGREEEDGDSSSENDTG